jgi:hypothetical protein
MNKKRREKKTSSGCSQFCLHQSSIAHLQARPTRVAVGWGEQTKEVKVLVRVFSF